MVTFNTKIKPEWVKFILDYQTGLDSNVNEYKDLIKKSSGKTFKQLADSIFKRIYPGTFPSSQLEEIYRSEFLTSFHNNVMSEIKTL